MIYLGRIIRKSSMLIPRIRQTSIRPSSTFARGEALDENRFITLDELAKICYPIQKAVIKAVQIDNRTKVFKNADSTEYFLGRPGDFMAVRIDDYSDIYIIQNEVFTRTYEESSM